MGLIGLGVLALFFLVVGSGSCLAYVLGSILSITWSPSPLPLICLKAILTMERYNREGQKKEKGSTEN